jgi:hypothetical protein
MGAQNRIASGTTAQCSLGSAWLREWPEAPRQKSLVGIVERLQAVRELGVEPTGRAGNGIRRERLRLIIWRCATTRCRIWSAGLPRTRRRGQEGVARSNCPLYCLALGANRPTGAVDDEAEDHLFEIGPVVLE